MIRKNYILIFTVLLFSLLITAQNKTNKTFHFGTKNTVSNTVYISEATAYKDTTGYGFDFNTANNVKFTKLGLTSKKPVYFSVKLPEGFYKIDLVLGDKKCSEKTIKAESRRLIFKEL
ncbi:hypothetical protein [Aestuariibaculum sediminum]|uniref:Uncharacterized protein n=1 Tax=Aestuariibaculum sediminum TaxID=2770637 RepID=A0A8J6Q133_9FLAO|nr:hypothetical protein [Aestuariibaculum sediminum]MBD0833738.1 hypothetical protein [Aestuariibaculum sediminum]